MGREKRVIDGKEVMVDVSVGADGKDVVTIVPEAPPKDVSQDAINRIWKQLKETEEKSATEIAGLKTQLQNSEQGKVDLVERIKNLEGKVVVPPAQPEKQYGPQADGSVVYPEGEEAWDELIADRPSFGLKLRDMYKEQVGGRVEGLRAAQLESAKKVANEILPGMYKKDADGKALISDGTQKMGDVVIPKGYPVPDESSDVYKVFCQVAAEGEVDAKGQPVIFQRPDGSELIALKVKNVMGTSREKELREKAEKERVEAEKRRNQGIVNNQVTPPGQSPPPPPTVEVKFNSDAEKEIAERKVAQGIYKDLEDYCRTRDNQVIPAGRGGV
jgi:hypothetical protein